MERATRIGLLDHGRWFVIMMPMRNTEVSRVVVAILTTALLVLSLTALAAVDPDKNQPEYWGEDCHKIDESQGGSWIADADYRLVVVKAGTDSHEFYNVVAGDVLSVGKDISHLILCTGGTPSTTTTIPLSTTLLNTTTIPTSTTTVVGTTVVTSVTTTSSSVPPETTTTTPTTTTEETTTSTLPTTTTTISSTTSSSSVATTQPTTPTTSLTTVTSSLPVTTTTVPITSDTPLALPLTGGELFRLAVAALVLLAVGTTLYLTARTKR